MTAAEMAKQYGVTPRIINTHGGVERILEMPEDVRRLILKPTPLKMSRKELLRGGLRRRGFTVHNCYRETAL